MPGGKGAVTYTVPSLTADTEYTFQVRAVNSGGTLVGSILGGTAGVTATPTALPAWQRAHSSAATRAYTVGSLDPDLHYTYRVRPVIQIVPNSALSPYTFTGETTKSVSWSGYAHTAGATGWEARKRTTTGQWGAWETVTGGASARTHTFTGMHPDIVYQFQVRRTNAKHGTEVDAGTATKSFPSAITVTGLTNGTAYTFKVRAVTSAGTGTASAAATATPVTSLLAPALTAVGLGTSARLDWTVSDAKNATGWEYRQAEPADDGLTAFPANASVDLLWATPASTTGIAKWQYRHKSGGSDFPATWTDVTGSSATTTSAVVGSLTNATAYTFQVRAVNSSDAIVGTALGDAAATPSATPWTSVSGAATRTATVTSLTETTRYAFQVRAVNAVGPGPVSNVAATYAAARPAKPTGLAATSGGHKRTTLSWPTTNTASTWQLRARQLAPTAMVIGSGLPERVTLSWDSVSRRGSWRYRQGTVSGGATTWGEWTYLSCGAPCGSATLTLTLANDTLYTYQVRNTEQGVATMMTNLRASQHPRNLVFGTGEAQDVVLDWTNPGSSGTTKWQYRKGAISGSTTTWDAAWTDVPCADDCSPLTMSSHTITTSSSVLTTGSVHVYQVRSEGSSNNYHYPSDLSVWHAFGAPPTVESNHTYAVTGLTNGLPHTFELRGLNAHDEVGAASDAATATPRVPAPTGLAATAGDATLTASWTDPGNSEITRYEYQLTTMGGTGAPIIPWSTVPNSGATTTTHTLTKLANNASFDYHLRVVSGQSTSTAVKVTATTQAKPRAIQGLYVRSVSDGRIRLNWDEPTDASITKLQACIGASCGDDSTWHDIVVRLNATPGSLRFTQQDWNTAQTVTLGWPVNTHRPPGDVTVTLEQDGVEFNPATLTFTKANNWTERYNVSVVLAARPRATTTIERWPALWPKATEVTAVGLTNHQQYRIQVRAVNASGAGPLREVFATPTPPPAAPANLAARPGDRKIDLNWDLVQGVTRYEYQKRTKTGEDWNRWAGVPIPVIPSPSSGRMWAEIPGLTNFTEYQFRVRAVNAAGGGDWATLTATPKAPLPDRPANLALTPGQQTMTLSWANPVAEEPLTGNAYRYRPRSSSDNGWTGWTEISGGATTSHEVTGLAAGELYTFQVRARNQSGAGWNSWAAFDWTYPAAPAGLTAAPGDRTVSLAWGRPYNSSIVRYEYQQKTAGAWGADWTPVPGSDSSTTQFAVGSLVNGTTYTFRVRAYSDGGGAISSEVTATPQPAPAMPTSVSATASGASSATVTWSHPDTSVIEKFQLRYKAGSAAWSAWADMAKTKTSYTIPEVAGVSNLAQAASTLPMSFNPSSSWAQEFTTGSASGGYTLSAVTLDFETVNNAAGVEVAVYTKSGGDVGTKTGVTLSGTPAVGQVAFTCTSGCNLAASASYYVRVSATGQSHGKLNNTASGAQTLLPSDNGWDIADIAVEQSTGFGPGSASANAMKLKLDAVTRNTATIMDYGTVYTFEVRAVNNQSQNSPGARASAATAPAAPTGFTAAPGFRQVALDWDNPKYPSIERWYYRYEQPEGGLAAFGNRYNVDLAWETPSSTTGIAGWQYRYKVGAGNFPATWTDVPDSSATTTAVRVGDFSVSAIYTFEVRAVNSSDVQVGSTLGPASTGLWLTPWTRIDGSTASTTSYVVTGLTTGVSYAFKVAAANPAGNPVAFGLPSAAVWAVPTPLPVPAAPTGLTLQVGDRNALLEWNHANDWSITRYEYRYKAAGAYPQTWTAISGSNRDTVHLRVAGLTNATTYSFQVRAVNAYGAGEHVQGSVTPAGPTDTGTPAPTTFTATDGDGQVSLAWTGTWPSTAFVEWQLYVEDRARSSGEQNIVIGVGGGRTGVRLHWVNPGKAGTTAWEYREGRIVSGGTTWGPWRAIDCESPCDPETMDFAALQRGFVPNTHYRYQVRATVNGSTELAQGVQAWANISTDVDTRSYTVNGVTNGSVYYFRLRAAYRASEAPWAFAVALPKAVPAKPTGFSATAGVGEVRLKWRASDDLYLDKYQYRQTQPVGGLAAFAGNATVDLLWSTPASTANIDGWQYRYKAVSAADFPGTWTDVPDSSATTTSATVSTGLTNDTAYLFQVRAVDTSDTIVGTALGDAGATPSASAGWTDLTPNRLCTLPAGEYPLDENNAVRSCTVTDDLFFTVTGLTNSVEHTFQVRGVNSAGPGPASDEATATPQSQPGRTTITATPGDGQIALAWNKPSGADVTKWRVRYISAGADWSAWHEITSSENTLSHTLTGLTNGYWHHVEVQAGNAVTWGLTAYVVALPLAPLAKPTGLTATPGHLKVALAWASSDTRLSGGWEMQQKKGTDAYGPWTRISNVPSDRSYTVNGLTNGVEYSFKVRAVTVYATGPASDAATATPLPDNVPAKPTSLSATARPARAHLSWTGPNSVTADSWEMRLTAGANDVVIGAGASRTIILSWDAPEEPDSILKYEYSDNSGEHLDGDLRNVQQARMHDNHQA